MKKHLTLFIALVLMATLVTAQSKEEFVNSLNGFLLDINTALPDSSIVGGIWSDAHIGQLIAVPPNFGIGLAAGATRFDSAGLKNAIKQADQTFPTELLALPNFAVEARVGGFILPFDAGVRVGFVPTIKTDTMSFDYLHFAGDVRYALMQQNAVLPNISLGLGVSHISGELSYRFNVATLMGFGTWVSVDDSLLKTNFQTTVYELKGQISKTYFIVTPYLGAGVHKAFSSSSWELMGETSSRDNELFGVRVFAGTSLNIFVIRLDLSGMYNITTENWGANLGLRLQL